jgi:hypothetical protein
MTACCRRAVGLAVLLAATAWVRGDEIWLLDNLSRIGGHPASIEGTPRVVNVPGAAPAIAFDGVDDGLFVPAIPIAGAKEFTIEVLFSPAEGGPEAQRFVHWQDANDWRGLIEIRVDGARWWLDTFLFTGEGRGVTLIDPKRTHLTGRWYWVALRFDGRAMAHFVNGEKEMENAASFRPFGAGRTSIGMRQNRVFWFKGAIRELRFHATALTAEKLQRVK